MKKVLIGFIMLSCLLLLVYFGLYRRPCIMLLGNMGCTEGYSVSLGTISYCQKSSVFITHYDCNIISGADISTFVSFDKSRAKDSNNVFIGYQNIVGADPVSFSRIKLVKKNTSKERDDSISYSDRSKDIHALYWGINQITGSDSTTFELLSREYAKDFNYVYYAGDIISGADSKTFHHIGEFDPYYFINNKGVPYNISYSMDKYNYFFNNYIIGKNKDGKSFRNMGGLYAKDNYDVYYHGQLIPLADSKTFEIIDSENDKNSKDYAKDINNVYFNGDLISGADSKTFEVIGIMEAKDANNIYDRWEVK